MRPVQSSPNRHAQTPVFCGGIRMQRQGNCFYVMTCSSGKSRLHINGECMVDVGRTVSRGADFLALLEAVSWGVPAIACEACFRAHVEGLLGVLGVEDGDGGFPGVECCDGAGELEGDRLGGGLWDGVGFVGGLCMGGKGGEVERKGARSDDGEEDERFHDV